jgi:hypothetical protein
MSQQPSAPSACLVAPAGAPLPGEVVPRALNRHPSASRIEPLASQTQSFRMKRLDDSRPLDSARDQRRLQICEVIQSNRLIVFCRTVRRRGVQATSTHSSNRPHSTARGRYHTDYRMR